METLKAGCFVIDVKSQKVALIYRVKQNDYSFPKGHLEKGETFKSCAIRETAEEIKRSVTVLDEYDPVIERYTTSKGENCICYMYIALDNGKSDNKSLDTHEVYWIPYEDVYEKLTYQNLKNTWNLIKTTIEKILNK